MATPSGTGEETPTSPVQPQVLNSAMKTMQ